MLKAQAVTHPHALSATAVIPLLALCFFWTPLQAQSLRQLENIIFEPVPLGEDEGPPLLAVNADAPPREGFDLTFRPGRQSFASGTPAPSLQTASTFAPQVGHDAALVPADEGLFDLDGGLQFEDLAELIEAWQVRIGLLEVDQGPYGADLSNPLMELGRLLQQQGRHEEALAVLERAEHVLRVNHGLFSLEQTRSVELGIQSLVALGRMPEADERRHYLHYLHEQFYGPGDPRLLPSLLSLAEWNMDAFQRGIRFEAESIFIESEFGRAGSEKGVRRMAFGKLYQARRAYLGAIRALVDGEHYQDPRLPGLEEKLVESYFLEAHRDGLLNDAANYLNQSHSSTGSLVRRRRDIGRLPVYDFGEESYLRSLAYLKSNPETPLVDFAAKLLELGDWHLLFGRRAPALERYEAARALLHSGGVDEAEQDRLFNPRVPVTLPVFTATPHTREIQGIPSGRDLAYQGYVDVRFLLGDAGRADELRVLGSSEGTSRAVERRLQRLIRQTQFRPRIGRTPREEIRLRYFYNY